MSTRSRPRRSSDASSERVHAVGGEVERRDALGVRRRRSARRASRPGTSSRPTLVEMRNESRGTRANARAGARLRQAGAVDAARCRRYVRRRRARPASSLSATSRGRRREHVAERRAAEAEPASTRARRFGRRPACVRSPSRGVDLAADRSVDRPPPCVFDLGVEPSSAGR